MKRLRFVLAGVGILLTGSYTPGAAQSKAVSTDVLQKDVKAVSTDMKLGQDRQIRIADIGNGNVAVAMVKRPADGSVQRAYVHTHVTEIYEMVEGAGTLVTDGALGDSTPIDPNSDVVKVFVGETLASTTIKNGKSRKVSAGDIIVIPAGVPHWWSTVDSNMTYLVYRLDPKRVLPAGYADPALKK